MTYQELVDLINTNLTRVGTNRVSAPEIKQVCQALLDFAAAIDNEDAIPTWTNLLTFQLDGTGAGKYCKHPDVNGKLRIFETKIANNTGNEPPTDPNITENTNWKEISASAGSGIHEWAPGLYGAGLVIVYHNHSVDPPGIYKLDEPVRPFNSTDIEAEITAGKWQRIGGSLSDWDLIAASVVSGTMTLDGANKRVRRFLNSVTISASTIIAFSNIANAKMLELHISVSGTVTLTLPSSVKMMLSEKNASRWNDATKVLTLVGTTDSPFKLVFSFDGTIWKLDASDRYL